MKTYIREKLKEIEQQYEVKVLYACETGSRAWGFPSPDSDYDIRIIYRHEPDWYISLFDKKDSIEAMLDNGELDITGWDIKKCLKLMLKSNGALLERLQSPIVYSETGNISTYLKRYSGQCFSPIATMHHYLGMAKTSFSDVEGKAEVKLKKLFYALRASLACLWILQKDSIPPIVFETMVHELEFDHNLKTRIRQLVELKSGKPESYMHPGESELNDFITQTLHKAQEAAGRLRAGNQSSAVLDGVLRDVIKNY